MPKPVKLLLNLIFSFLLVVPSFAQLISPPQWDIQFSNKNPQVGEEVELVFKARIPANWYIYSNDFDPDLGPLLTELMLEDSTGVERSAILKAIDPKTKYEEGWEGDVTYFDKGGEFRQSFIITAEAVKVAGHLFYQMCSDITGQCVKYEEDFTLQLTAQTVGAPTEAGDEVAFNVVPHADSVGLSDTKVEEAEERQPADIQETKQDFSPQVPAEAVEASAQKEKASMIGFMILAFLGGLAALLTPCVFPMIPMTVTFFTGRAKSRAQGIRNALIYGFSIIAIYTLAGTLVAATQGPEFANWLSTHW